MFAKLKTIKNLRAPFRDWLRKDLSIKSIKELVADCKNAYKDGGYTTNTITLTYNDINVGQNAAPPSFRREEILISDLNDNPIINLEDIEIGGDYKYRERFMAGYFGTIEYSKIYIGDIDIFKEKEAILDIFITNKQKTDAKDKIYFSYKEQKFYFKLPQITHTTTGISMSGFVNWGTITGMAFNSQSISGQAVPVLKRGIYTKNLGGSGKI